MIPPTVIVFSSYGNDSIALIQHAKESRWYDVSVVYSVTGWASKWWPERVERMESWVRSCGFTPVQLVSEGMVALVTRKKGWPRQGIQFCTEELKIKPAMAWLAASDPHGESVCVVGVRREESANRRDYPVWREESPAHGGRICHAPLATLDVAERDALIRRAGFDPLPHRSRECYPCINSNRADMRALAVDEATIAGIEAIETRLGVSPTTGKPKTMFRPARHMGATGIREVIRWAKSERGEFSLDDGTGGGNCDGGYCGT